MIESIISLDIFLGFAYILNQCYNRHDNNNPCFVIVVVELMRSISDSPHLLFWLDVNLDVWRLIPSRIIFLCRDGEDDTIVF